MDRSNVFAMRTSGGSVKVVFEGQHYLKTENADEIYAAAQQLRKKDTEEYRERLRNLLDPHYREVVMSDLERDNLGNLYLEGFNQPLGEGMVSLIEEHHEQDLPTAPFKEFWKRLQLNPNQKAREDFFEYVRDFGLTITDEGYVILYKAVDRNPHADLDNDLVEFVGQEYLKHQVSRSNPNPEDVFVVEDEDGEYAIVEEEATSTVPPIEDDVDFLNVGDLSVTNLLEEAKARGIVDQINGLEFRFEGIDHVLGHLKDDDPDAYPLPDIRDALRKEVMCPKDVVLADFEDDPRTLLPVMKHEGVINDYEFQGINKVSVTRDGRSVLLDSLENTKMGDRMAEDLAAARPDLVDPTPDTTELEYHGTLAEMYTLIVESSDAQFQPWYEGGEYGNEIDLGEMISMPREECDPNSNVACSQGLHVGSHKYVESFGSNMDVILACVVSPRDIVALPDRDHSKVRFCRYLPYATMERNDDGSWEEIEAVQVSTHRLEDDFDYGGALENLENQEDLSDVQQDRKKILEERVQQLHTAE
jgi:hypothetical protein